MDRLPGLPRLDRGGARLPRLPGVAGPGNPASEARPRDFIMPSAEETRPWLKRPGDFRGSPSEYAIFWAHEHAVPPRGPVYGDWSFKTFLFGSFMPLGFLPDFIEYDLNIVIEMNDEEINREIAVVRALILSSLRPPWTYVIIDEEDALMSPVFYLNEALQGISHSHYGRLV